MSKHIAMLCMSLNIGGAETHIYELSKQLRREGNDVTVFSNGGVYVSSLKEADVHHIQTPLHSKSPCSLLRSYFTLLKEFRKHRPSVVHSHTRISNLIAWLVCRQLRIPLVTTVHYNFRSDFIFRIFSNWGCRALAVSEDLKEYLIDRYNYNPDHVRVTVNGIDMERFKKRSNEDFKASLGIQPNQKVILLVSRLDKEASIHVSRFLDIAPEIYKNCPDTRVLLVGSGSQYAQFSLRANMINKQCGTDFIQLQGAQTEIEKYTNVADLFIGISRAALEAMASGIPTILLGNSGYLGLYSDDIKDACISTNLTCRGYPYPSNEKLIRLVCDCLQHMDLTKNIRDGRRLVEKEFSIERMVSDAKAVYNNAIDLLRPLDYMISGYYGRNNFGDNLTLHGLMGHLKNYRGTVLTCNPKNTAVPQNVELIHRFNLWKIRKIMKKTKVFLFGSGSILQDATSNRSIFYYYFVMKMALRYHCKTMLYANGIGPITKEKNRKNVARILEKVDLITLRDQDSVDLLARLQPNRQAFLTQDDAFSYDTENMQPISPSMQTNGKTIVGVNFKFNSAQDPKIKEIAEGLRSLAEQFDLYYYLIPYHLSQDILSLKALHQELPDCSELSSTPNSPESLIHYATSCKYQIVERLHGQIISTMLGQPFLPINYDPKTKSFAEQTGMVGYLIEHNDLTKDSLIETFKKILDKHSEIEKNLLLFNQKAKKDASLNREHLYQIIKDF